MTKRILILLEALIFLNHGVVAQTRNDQFDSIFTQLNRENKFSGNVLIADKGRPIFQKSYGLAFREKNEALHNESVFEICSIGKQFTATLIMMLKAQGKLDYSDSLRKFLPELPYHNITIRQMLNHTSGLPDYIDLIEKHWDTTRIIMNEDAIALMAEKKPPVEFEPGTQWNYSNTGYLLLCSIIEKITGQNFIQYVDEHIFRPLDMKHTQVYRKRFEKRTIQNYAYGYVWDDNKNDYIMADSSDAEKGFVYYMDGIYGDGVTSSSAPDMLRWDQSLYSDKLVSKEMIEEAFTPAVLKDGSSFGYGFAWMIKNTKEFGKIMMHSGGWPGYRTWLERHPASNKTIIIFANSGDAFEKLGKVRYLLYNLKGPEFKETALMPAQMKPLTGKYKFSGFSFSITLEHDTLYFEGTRQPKTKLFASIDGSFHTVAKRSKLRFIKNSRNEVTHLVIDPYSYAEIRLRKETEKMPGLNAEMK